MRISYGNLSRTGVRETNQDAMGIFADELVFAIADGMGGLEHGERVSAAAIDAVRQAIPRLNERARALTGGASPEARTALFQELETLFTRSATELYNMAEQAGMRMGTTLTVVVLAGDRLVIGHVGDTRVYRVRKGQVKLLTEDHSVAASQLRRGQLTPEDYNKSPQRSVLYQSLGTTAEIEPDIVEASLQTGDVLVMCSDGVWAHVDPAALIQHTGVEDPRLAARGLADLAIAQGSDDNCTAIVVRVLSQSTHTSSSLPRALAVCSLFKDFKEQDLRLLGPYIQHRDLAEGEHLFREGDAGEEMFILESGSVELSRQGFPLAQLTTGTHFGELALMGNATHTVSARAVMVGRVLVLNRRYLDALIARRPDLASAVLRTLLADVANRLVAFNERLGRAERALWTSK